MLISARYADVDKTIIVALDDAGQEWHLAPDCAAGVWLEYIAGGGEIAAYEEPDPSFPPLTPRQIRLGLLDAGITESMVDAALVGNDEGLIEWKYASQYNRDHPLISALAGSFSLTGEQIDTLWLSAAQL